MKAYLLIYLIINYTLACFHLGSEWRFSDGSGKIYECLRFVWMSLFGIPIYFTYFLWDFIQESFTFLQLKFFYLYFFTKRFYNIEAHVLEEQRRICENVFNTNSMKHRLYRRCANLIRVRNGLDLITESKNKE